MKLFLAIVVCKLVRIIGKAVGKGSSMPGKIALKLCPDLLKRLTLPPTIVAVTGSNGKTSTVEMIGAIFRASGKTLVYNQEGANQTEGVVTALLTHATLGGKVNADVLLLESDERYAKFTFSQIHPTHFVITNLYRDQLTRNGHPQWVARDIQAALHPQTHLILNADDPQVSCFAGESAVTWFGVDGGDHTAPTGVYHDGTHCPKCHGLMEYTAVHYNHIGNYKCTNCGFKRENTNYTVTDLDLSSGRMVIDGETQIQLAFASIYHVYNTLAAYALCNLCGVDKGVIAKTINGYLLQNGRVQRFRLGEHHGTLLTSKHENSIAYDTNLRYIASQKELCDVVVIVEDISRKYFTSETSWLWDIDFNLLDCGHVNTLHLAGQYAHDLALRMEFTTVSPEKVKVYPTVENVVELLKTPAASGDLPLFVVTCFSDRDKLLRHTTKEVQP
ncbi:MurT ligase domain-containing protein [Bengtsoniella intestinalis]|uniref:MurT ligase domain-containing protein n=1 Tax=Bengtsoniella intestinalis TaxID=3073143 RepID=UPI00391FB33A